MRCFVCLLPTNGLLVKNAINFRYHYAMQELNLYFKLIMLITEREGVSVKVTIDLELEAEN